MPQQSARDHVDDYLHHSGRFRDHLFEEQRWALYCRADGFGSRSEDELRSLNGGWDWSHIRDATPVATQGMSDLLTSFGHPRLNEPAEPGSLDALLDQEVRIGDRSPLPADLESAQALIQRRFGQFWITTTLDGSSASATLGPDYNSDTTTALQILWPIEIGDRGFHAEIVVAGRPATEADLARAVVMAAAKAERARTLPELGEPRPLRALYDLVLRNHENSGYALSREIRLALGQPIDGEDLTRDLAAVRRFVEAVLPGYVITTGLCYLTGHATISAPKAADGSRARWSEDIEPGEGSADLNCQCLSILLCALKAAGGFTPADEDDEADSDASEDEDEGDNA